MLITQNIMATLTCSNGRNLGWYTLCYYFIYLIYNSYLFYLFILFIILFIYLSFISINCGYRLYFDES